MAIVLRVPKRQFRIAVVGLAVVALGAGVAAQTPRPAQPVAAERHAAPAVAPPQQAQPTTSAAVTAQRQQATPAQEQQPTADQEQQPAPAQEQQPPPAQQEPPAQPQSTTPRPAQTGAPDLLTPQEREALELVERLIREQEGVLMGTGFDYDPGGRRDPFRSLLAEISAVSAPSVRPFGLPGFLISEIDLKAIAAVQGRWHAMVIGPNQRAYFLEVGTELFDGHVVSIGPGEVVFEQIVPDPTGARRTRQVTKRLRTTDGGGETP